ncbi:DUF937 domain-containing protein [Phycicoccus sonneratiae]|uniref:DUF937 domain-containing protein n=1 Tax=Phycicoccus sonneratiae TaxID=2807628 RepID=A0ABS2CL04_9MICO|nr:DUF937 domain-containing protein [Phycicoccus sonneraticus]MBM6400544.1 DUF937 domain-containing protein [Phycicoccus sonneraticus]
MSAYDDILGALPVDDIAGRVGASPDDVRQAAAAVVPALLGGLDANAQGGGAGSLLDALGQHDPGLLAGGADLAQLDEQDGAAIAGHIFGDRQDDVAARLGESPLTGQGVGGALVRKLIPILAPMVLSWLAGRVLGGSRGGSTGGSAGTPAPSPSLPGGGSSGGGPGSLEDMLKDVLGSATGGAAQGGSSGKAPSSGGLDAGSIIGDVLGGILGGGRR